MENKDKIGIIKGFDKLGRIVIPKELRERFSLEDSVEIIATTDGVLLRNPEYKLVKKEKIKKRHRTLNLRKNLCLYVLLVNDT